MLMWYKIKGSMIEDYTVTYGIIMSLSLKQSKNVFKVGKESPPHDNESVREGKKEKYNYE